MAAMFPTERSGVPMFGMDTAVDKAASRRQSATAAPETAADKVLSDPMYQQFVGEPRAKLEKAQKEYGAFEGELAADKAAREATQLGRRQEAFGAYEQAVKAPELRAERTQLEERAGEAFVPTQENVQDMTTIFSLVSVLGFAIGAGGKSNAIGAMNAMNGMMQGYQQGRKDRYLREKDLFEANTKALKTKIDALNNRMADIAKLAAVDMEKANMEADMLFAQEGADFLKQYKDKVGLVNTIKMLQEQVKGGEKLFEFIEKERTRAAEKETQRQFQISMQKDRQQNARDMKYLAASLRQNQEKTGLKPGAKVTEGYVANNQLLVDLSYMKDQLRDPEVTKLLKDYRVEGFLSEENKALNQIISTDIPPKLRKFLTTVRDIRNNYYLTISGKAVTGGEALRSYGTVPQPGDTADMMLDKISGMENRVNNTIELTRRLYPVLPVLRGTQQPGQPTNLRPNEDYLRESSEPTLPGRPSDVPADAAYSPSQNKWWWKDSAGNWKSK